MNNYTNPYNKTVKFAKITAIASAALAAVIALSYFFALRFDFDYSIGHFERGSALFYILAGAIIVAVALSAAVSLFAKKKASITSIPSASGAPTFISVFAAVMAAAALISEIFALTSQRAPGKLAMISAIGLIAVVLGVSTLISDKTNTSKLAQIALPLAALATAVRILDAYFDQTLTLNSPVRYITMLAELSVMLLLLSESRISFGIEITENGGTARRAFLPFYLFANNACASLAIGFSVGALLHELIPMDITDAKAVTATHPSLFRLALYLTIGALALARALTVHKIIGEYIPSPFENKKKDSTDEDLAETEEIQSEKE